MDCLLFAPVFEILLTHGHWSKAWPYGQAQGQWRTVQLKGCPYRAQPYGNHPGSSRGALQQDMSMPILLVPGLWFIMVIEWWYLEANVIERRFLLLTLEPQCTKLCMGEVQLALPLIEVDGWLGAVGVLDRRRGHRRLAGRLVLPQEVHIIANGHSGCYGSLGLYIYRFPEGRGHVTCHTGSQEKAPMLIRTQKAMRGRPKPGPLFGLPWEKQGGAG